MSAHRPSTTGRSTVAVPADRDHATWEAALAELRCAGEAAHRWSSTPSPRPRRRLPMVSSRVHPRGSRRPGPAGDVFEGSVSSSSTTTCVPERDVAVPGLHGLTSRNTRLEFLDAYDARFVIVTQGPIDEALASRPARQQDDVVLHRRQPVRQPTWASSRRRLPGHVFLRDGETSTAHEHQGRGTEQLSHTFPLIDLLPYGRQEEWQDSPEGWPQSPTYSRWAGAEAYARYAD